MKTTPVQGSEVFWIVWTAFCRLGSLTSKVIEVKIILYFKDGLKVPDKNSQKQSLMNLKVIAFGCDGVI
jgi:hypothetical protein